MPNYSEKADKIKECMKDTSDFPMAGTSNSAFQLNEPFFNYAISEGSAGTYAGFNTCYPPPVAEPPLASPSTLPLSALIEITSNATSSP